MKGEGKRQARMWRGKEGRKDNGSLPACLFSGKTERERPPCGAMRRAFKRGKAGGCECPPNKRGRLRTEKGKKRLTVLWTDAAVGKCPGGPSDGGFQTVSLRGIHRGWYSQKKERPLNSSGRPSSGGWAVFTLTRHIFLILSHSWLRLRYRRIHKTEARQAFKTAPGTQKTSGEYEEEPPDKAEAFSFLLGSATGND